MPMWRRGLAASIAGSVALTTSSVVVWSGGDISLGGGAAWSHVSGALWLASSNSLTSGSGVGGSLSVSGAGVLVKNASSTTSAIGVQP